MRANAGAWRCGVITSPLSRFGACAAVGHELVYNRRVQPQFRDLAQGSIVGGDFRVVAPLSSGGMGAVYLAEQISTGKRRALKVMHPSMVADPGLKARFAQEARVGSMIASDHVVQVVAAGIDPESGAPWIAMELLEGENFADYLARRGPLSPPELGSILTQLCHALGHAHTAGVVHRDIKPENVFIAQTQTTTGPFAVKVLDFGIAKVAARAHATATGVLGTPLWMAPEQSEALGRISPATDVWAVGLLAYWALTGLHYWRSSNSGAPSVHALMREVLFDPLDAPSLRAHELGRGERIPPGFDAWFSRAVARDPAARFADANALRVDYHASVLGVAPLPSVPPPAPAAPPALSSSPHSAASPIASTQLSTSLPPARRGSSVGVWIGIGGLLVAFAAIAAAAGSIYWFVWRERTPTARPALTAIASAQPSPPPSAETSSSPVAPVQKAPTAPVPTGSSAPPIASRSERPAAAKPSAPEKKPFDSAKANLEVNQRALIAKQACSSAPGPPVVSGTVRFRNDGHCTVLMNDAFRISQRQTCVLGQMASSVVPPFDGPSGSVPFTVGF